MIKTSEITKDEFVDDALSIIRTLNARKGWTREARANRKKLRLLLKGKGYISFLGGYERYLGGRIGHSYLYDVPMKKRGYLSKFRGKRVRIVCVSSGTFKQEYMAGIVGEIPPEKMAIMQDR